ncbi:MAG TPA: hypothetical protein VFL93_00320 [Longimicrobiaceae bacterium]|nr:hypothetical protein [Longimicrobiaceae bacterium]
MAGKRPDQYQITHREAGATDYKFNPESSHGKGGDLDTREGDKQRLARSRQQAEGQPFLPDVPAPSAEANRAASAQRDREEEERSE